ncbi:filamentous hemagglutinin N-terminal domain-containing protein [Leptolyngbya cf. ectocarpi LEGE 11479]|uniref:Filamentous hemagglutinin N-terminal domain-containing protein n=1 Tax=Leptolyngbya cf. ectocarpi LEGE 11479 TaxID=1828722 RepID=A0A928ZTA8_LEPEC|nr:filamentous hemagglutinin N-terminal domain-containing protein [Leptolyngbya ectocarpi]MBE9066866.1 filamentous hemagglutinin N-terminal domain-containing protein [Leptolyngbya cf. ectocarpi LEGE 11479]
MLSYKANVICLITAILAGSFKPIQAQIIPDDTLGNEASQVSVDATVQGLPTDLIEGGATRGVNLFHSFSDFNVADLQRVYFANPTHIENILSRVTGDSRSNILGTLGIDGTANLFLLNPNGIVFGKNAQLDITGSFFASTANALELDGGLSYSALEPTAPPLLAVTLTPGLQYGAAQQGEISNAGILQTGEGLTFNAETLTLNGSLLAGADLTLRSSDTIQIRDSETQPFIAAATGDVLVQGDQTVDIFALNHSDSGLFAGQDLILRSANSIIGDTHYWSGNRFQVETLDGTPGNLLSPNDPVIQSGGDISFANYTGASLRVLAGGSVTANNITITGVDPGFPDEAVTLSRPLADGTNIVQVNGSTRPVVDIRAGTTAATQGLNCDGCPDFLGIILQPTDLSSTAIPTSADITINRIGVNPSDGLVLLTNQFQPDASIDGSIQVQEIDTGNNVAEGGEIILDSRNSIVLPTSSLVRSSALDQNSGNISFIAQDAVSLAESAIVQSASGGTGQAGNINILAGSFSLLREAQLDASATGNGNSGNSGTINIDVSNAITLTGFNTRINNSVSAGTRADTGEINIRANSLSIEEGAGIFSTILGEGNGSNITLDINGAVALDGRDGSNSAIATGVGDAGSGNSGQIDLRAESLNLTNGGLISTFAASSNSIANAGDINLDVRDFILVEGDTPPDTGPIASQFIFADMSAIASGQVGNGNIGDSGNIVVNTDRLMVQDSAVIDASHTGQGRSGDIEINARIVNLNDGGSVTTLSTGTGNAGIISIVNAEETNLDNNSFISTSSLFKSGDSGALVIETDTLSLRNDSILATATANSGNAGQLEIQADLVELINGSRITTETGPTTLLGIILSSGSTGNAGNLTIDTNRLVLQDGAISTSASITSSGQAGLLTVNASESIDISGIDGTNTGGLFASSF